MALLTPIKTRVELALRRPVASLHEGTHRAIHIGRSHEFHDLREYVVGDNIRDIDWRATARSGQLLVKRYKAQRQATLMLVVASGRSFAGLASARRTKRDVAIDVAGTLGMIATQHADRGGFLWMRDGEVRAARPRSGVLDLERGLQGIVDASQLDSMEADLPLLLDRAIQSSNRRLVMAIIADDVDMDAPVEAKLRRLAAQHDVWYFSLLDALPSDLAGDVVGIGDARRIPAFLRKHPRVREEFEAQRQARIDTRHIALQRLSIRHLEVTDDDVVRTVVDAVRRWGRVR